MTTHTITVQRAGDLACRLTRGDVPTSVIHNTLRFPTRFDLHGVGSIEIDERDVLMPPPLAGLLRSGHNCVTLHELLHHFVAPDAPAAGCCEATPTSAPGAEKAAEGIKAYAQFVAEGGAPGEGQPFHMVVTITDWYRRWTLSEVPGLQVVATPAGLPEGEVAPVFPTMDAAGVAAYIASKNIKKILVMCGAGISVAAGIPDFRTPGTGLYSRLEKYKLPRPESLFTIDYLRTNPSMFYEVADDMKLWPGHFPPTHVHHFVAMLAAKGLLLRCYTQNIDCLERGAGLTDDEIMEAHGTFATASCIDCKKPFDVKLLMEHAQRREVPRCPKCSGIVKPDVVFFGEGLPRRFFRLLETDIEEAELLLVLGTSLQVQPFAGIHEMVDEKVPRVLVNMERAGDFTFAGDLRRTPGFPVRDLFLKGDCQRSVIDLAQHMGMADELAARHAAGVAAVARKQQEEAVTAAVGSSSL